MKQKRLISIILIVFVMSCIVTVSTTVLFVNSSQAGMFSKTVVKLYSNGQVVGTWEAADIGKVDGSSLVFSIKSDKSTKVRICGTYSIETMK